MVAPIVGGHGDREAVALLVRRIAHERLHLYDVKVAPAFRLPRTQMVDQRLLYRAAMLQAHRVSDAGAGGGVLVVADADDDCPVELAQRMRGHLVGLDTSVAVVVAQREYEAWLLAGLPSLRRHGLVRDAGEYGEPEKVRAAKSALSDRLTEPYRETIHQASLTGSVSLAACAERSRSFRHLETAVASLLRSA
jgi:hypothetical protein